MKWKLPLLLETLSQSIKVDGSDELKVLAKSAGIFYRASSPAEPDFVLEGDIVTTEQTLGLNGSDEDVLTDNAGKL